MTTRKRITGNSKSLNNQQFNKLGKHYEEWK